MIAVLMTFLGGIILGLTLETGWKNLLLAILGLSLIVFGSHL